MVGQHDDERQQQQEQEQDAASSSTSHAGQSQEQQQQQQDQRSPARDRNGSARIDSGISMSSLEASLPSSQQDAKVDGDQHRYDATEVGHADGQDSLAGGADDGDRQIDEHEKALRRYSSEVAAHTAQMFETCYGGTISEGANSSHTSSSSSTVSSSPTSRRGGRRDREQAYPSDPAQSASSNRSRHSSGKTSEEVL